MNQDNFLLPTPTQTVSYLNRFVKGQHRAKKIIALALYSHFLQTLSCKKSNHDRQVDRFITQHLLLIGPTGCGKSYLVKKATEYFKVHCSFFSATSLVQTGYAGLKIDEMIQSHYLASGKDIDQTQLSVIFLDEIDKIRVQRHFHGPDISGEGVQNALLTLLDGSPVDIFVGKNKKDSDRLKLKTKHILFIGTGAFSAGLADIIRARTQENDLDNEEILSLANTEDLIHFGFIPEFVGRFSSIVPLKSLQTEDLVHILSESQESPLKKHQHLFQLHGINLDFTSGALAIIAKKAIQLKTGARALNRTFQESLLELEFQLPELAHKGVSKITIDEYSLLEGRPNFEYLPNFNGIKNIDRIQGNLIEIENFTENKSARKVNEKSRIDRNQISDIQGWSNSQIQTKIEEVKNQIGWERTTENARQWWQSFEQKKNNRLALILRVLEELLIREATINEFFLAYASSNTDNIQANLHYLDYDRLKKEEEKNKLIQTD